MEQRKYDSTVARIAGNLLSGAAADWMPGGQKRDMAVKAAIATARLIVSEIQRPEEPVTANAVREDSR